MNYAYIDSQNLNLGIQTQKKAPLKDETVKRC